MCHSPAFEVTLILDEGDINSENTLCVVTHALIRRVLFISAPWRKTEKAN